jgi:hypothetical protein
MELQQPRFPWRSLIICCLIIILAFVLIFFLTADGTSYNVDGN